MKVTVAFRRLANASEQTATRAGKGNLARLTCCSGVGGGFGGHVITRSKKAGGLGLASAAARLHVLA